MLPLNILSVIKYNGMASLEKHGFSNLNYHTVSLKKIMPIKELLDSELEKMSKTSKHSESELTHTLEIILQLQSSQVSSYQTLQGYNSPTLSPSSFTAVQIQILVATLSQTSSITSVVPSATVIEVNMFVLTLMGNMF